MEQFSDGGDEKQTLKVLLAVLHGNKALNMHFFKDLINLVLLFSILIKNSSVSPEWPSIHQVTTGTSCRNIYPQQEIFKYIYCQKRNL